MACSQRYQSETCDILFDTNFVGKEKWEKLCDLFVC
jgi:hypothetical protein